MFLEQQIRILACYIYCVQINSLGEHKKRLSKTLKTLQTLKYWYMEINAFLQTLMQFFLMTFKAEMLLKCFMLSCKEELRS